MNVTKVRFFAPETVEKHNRILPWIACLDDTLVLDGYAQLGARRQNDGQGWLEKVLTLSLALLQVLRAPVFSPLEIVDCKKCNDGAQHWVGQFRAPDTSRVPTPVLHSVIKVAFQLAAWAVTADPASSKHREHFYKVIHEKIQQPNSGGVSKGKSTFAVLRCASAMNMPFLGLPNGVFQLGWGCNSHRLDRSSSENDSAIGMEWTRSKFQTAKLLRMAGLPAPTHIRVGTVEQARQAAEEIQYPLVIKPVDAERGEGVTVDVQAHHLEAAFDLAMKHSYRKSVLVERQAAGVCYRIFITAGKLLYAVRRLPIGVYADGLSSIDELVSRECQRQSRRPPWKRSGIQPIDELALSTLRRKGWGPESVPPVGAFVALRPIESTAWGGVDEDVSRLMHPDNIKAAVAATKLIGLEVAGVDMISPDIRQPWHANDAIINEVNYSPLLGGGEISQSRVGEYLRRLVNNNGQIPVHVYIGGPDAWAKAKDHWKRLADNGVAACLTSATETLDCSGDQIPLSRNALKHRLRALRLRSDVAAIVVVLQSVRSLLECDVLDCLSSVEVGDIDLLLTDGNPENVDRHSILAQIEQVKKKHSGFEAGDPEIRKHQMA
jgi:cyanophycin synthetase